MGAQVVGERPDARRSGTPSRPWYAGRVHGVPPDEPGAPRAIAGAILVLVGWAVLGAALAIALGGRVVSPAEPEIEASRLVTIAQIEGRVRAAQHLTRLVGRGPALEVMLSAPSRWPRPTTSGLTRASSARLSASRRCRPACVLRSSAVSRPGTRRSISLASSTEGDMAESVCLHPGLRSGRAFARADGDERGAADPDADRPARRDEDEGPVGGADRTRHRHRGGHGRLRHAAAPGRALGR